MSRNALGRGLSNLIPKKPPEAGAAAAPAPHAGAHPGPGLHQLDIDRIVPSPYQPRKDFAADRLDELAQSIKARGVIQPLIVRHLADGRYELIAGERRWRAARQAGLSRVPAVVRGAEAEEAMELALVENIQREDLNPIETAMAYQQLQETFALTHEAIATRVGKDRTSVTNHLRLLALPDKIQAEVAAGVIGMGHARALLGLPGKEAQLAAGKTVVAKGLSVRETEKLVKRLTEPRRKAEPENDKKDIHIKKLEDSIRRALGTKVSIRHHGEAGVIELHYFSAGEMERIVNHLGAKEYA